MSVQEELGIPENKVGPLPPLFENGLQYLKYVCGALYDEIEDLADKDAFREWDEHWHPEGRVRSGVPMECHSDKEQ